MHQVYLVIGSKDLDTTMDLFGYETNEEFHEGDIDDLLAETGEDTLEEALETGSVTSGLDMFEEPVYGVMRNERAFWDWWELGGRWKNSLVNEEGEVCDSCEKVDALKTLTLNRPSTLGRKSLNWLGRFGFEVIAHDQDPYEVKGFFTVWALLETSENLHVVDCHS